METVLQRSVNDAFGEDRVWLTICQYIIYFLPQYITMIPNFSHLVNKKIEKGVDKLKTGVYNTHTRLRL
jgi:hypothetical protein